MGEFTDQEIAMVAPILQRLVRADKDTRMRIQEFGVNILAINMYSNTPSLQKIERSYEYATDEPPYSNELLFDKKRLGDSLEKLLEFLTEFDPPIEGDEDDSQTFFWENSQFSYSDAMAYYSFNRLAKPSNVVEIGSGFSTLVTLDAIEKNGFGTVHCIEPFPRNFLESDDRISLHISRAQDIHSEFLNDTLRNGDILFIDSTHTVKTGSDCLHIYLRLLPTIQRDVYVHVHDVFLPFGMPKEWLSERQLFWTEQYLLLALLIDNPKASILYGSTYNVTWNYSLMQELMQGKYPPGGGSLWFKYDGSLNARTIR